MLEEALRCNLGWPALCSSLRRMLSDNVVLRGLLESGIGLP